jgi:hypothetical protein
MQAERNHTAQTKMPAITPQQQQQHLTITELQ